MNARSKSLNIAQVKGAAEGWSIVYYIFAFIRVGG